MVKRKRTPPDRMLRSEVRKFQQMFGQWLLDHAIQTYEYRFPKDIWGDKVKMDWQTQTRYGLLTIHVLTDEAHIHTRFAESDRAEHLAGRTGKWNHYCFDRRTAAEWFSIIVGELDSLDVVKPDAIRFRVVNDHEKMVIMQGQWPSELLPCTVTAKSREEAIHEVAEDTGVSATVLNAFPV